MLWPLRENEKENWCNPSKKSVLSFVCARTLCELLLGAAWYSATRQAGLSEALRLPNGGERGGRRVSLCIQERIHGQDEGHLSLRSWSEKKQSEAQISQWNKPLWFTLLLWLNIHAHYYPSLYFYKTQKRTLPS